MLGACCAFMSLSSLAASNEQERGFYIKGDVGGNITEDLTLKEFFGPVAPGSKVKLDPGFRAGIAGGYQATDWLAGELELGFMGNRINEVTGSTALHDAYFSNIPFLFNLKLQYPTRCPFKPYAGAGVGFSEAVFDIEHLDLNDIHMSGSDSDTVFAWQAFAGIRYALNERMGLSVEYRYFYADSPTWDAEFAVGTLSDHMSFGTTHTHAISLAFDFRF